MPIFRALREAATRDPVVAFAQVWQMMDLPPWSEPGWSGRMRYRTLYEAVVHLVDYGGGRRAQIVRNRLCRGPTQYGCAGIQRSR